ncbi:MAG: O-antigen ligase family protein [Gelidibacter sp.]
MKLFRYLLLILLVCNVPSIVQLGYGDLAGSLLSYATFGLLMIFYFLSKKHALAWPFVIFAIIYFSIAGLVNVFDEQLYFIDFIKYLIIIVCGGELARSLSAKEMYVAFVIGSASILIHSAFFPDDYGRYSGFYLNANAAGFACLLGVALSYSIKKELWKNLGLAFCTFCGILTFSRTFFLLWFLLVVISIFQNKKNFKIFGLGVGVILLFLSLAAILQVNDTRFSIFEAMFTQGVVSKSVEADSRTETWSLYYDKVYDSPFVGNGYLSFTSDNLHAEGAHNNYLRIIGEAGILPFLLFTGIMLYLLIKSVQYFKTEPWLFLLAVSIFSVNLTNHNFDTLQYITLITLWLYFKLHENKVQTFEP